MSVVSRASQGLPSPGPPAGFAPRGVTSERGRRTPDLAFAPGARVHGALGAAREGGRPAEDVVRVAAFRDLAGSVV